MVHIWGGAWNKDANPSIEKDLGIKEGCYYFKTKEDKDHFVNALQNPIYQNQGLMIVTKYGIMSHKRTIFVGKYKYNDKEFVIHHDFGYEYPKEDAIYMFEYGNYSCDCNISLFIQDEYGKEAIPELECGNEIELISYYITYAD